MFHAVLRQQIIKYINKVWMCVIDLADIVFFCITWYSNTGVHMIDLANWFVQIFLSKLWSLTLTKDYGCDWFFYLCKACFVLCLTLLFTNFAELWNVERRMWEIKCLFIIWVFAFVLFSYPDEWCSLRCSLNREFRLYFEWTFCNEKLVRDCMGVRFVRRGDLVNVDH